MNNFSDDLQNRELMSKVTEVAIRLFLVTALAAWCFLLFKPFLMPLVWGIVIAVAMSPLFSRLESLLGGRRKLAGTLFILVGLGVLVVPTYLLSESFITGMKWLSVQEHKDAIHIPPPPAEVADWPLIGDRVHELWTHASENLAATLTQFAPQVRSFGSWLLSTLAGFGVALLMTLVAIVIAGVMLMHSEGGGRTARAIG
ncbi:MAG: AI-2E family transporter, partial [Gammaproteobacteria bacterium]|nr:AI-2E family transporter [Gammaproteobacteria bacterium]